MVRITIIAKAGVRVSTFLIIFAMHLHGTDYRVSSAGQVSTAMAAAIPGDTLTMVSGTWTNANISFAGFGTSIAPILLRAETAGGVVLTGTSTLRISGKHLIVDGLLFINGSSPSGDVIEFRGSNGESDSCRLTNCTVRDYNPADSTKDYKWVSLYGTHNRVDHCYFKGKKHSGTTLVVWLSSKANFHQIDHNYFALRPVLYGWNGGETIRIGTSDWSMYDSFTTVEYNYFEECNGEIETISNKSCGNIYRYNTFVSCQGTLTLRHGNRCIVEGNFFFGNHAPNSGGVRIIGEDHQVFNNYISGTDGSSMKTALTLVNGVPNSPLDRYFQVKRAIVAFNTFVDNRYTVNIGGGKDTELSLPPLDCIIADNIIWGSHSPLVTFTDTPVNMLWSGNIFYGASVGMSTPAGNTVANPQLIRGADSLWRLGGTSPAIGAAAGSYPMVVDDMDGQDRTTPMDVGADQYSALSIRRKPLTRADVGPLTTVTSVRHETGWQPDRSSLLLFNNYPNPFNPTTVISFHLSTPDFVEMKIFDLLGKEVETLVHRPVNAGRHEVKWNASGVGSGVYFCRLQCGEEVRTTKVVLLR